MVGYGGPVVGCGGPVVGCRGLVVGHGGLGPRSTGVVGTRAPARHPRLAALHRRPLLPSGARRVVWSVRQEEGKGDLRLLPHVPGLVPWVWG